MGKLGSEPEEPPSRSSCRIGGSLFLKARALGYPLSGCLGGEGSSSVT